MVFTKDIPAHVLYSDNSLYHWVESYFFPMSRNSIKLQLRNAEESGIKLSNFVWLYNLFDDGLEIYYQHFIYTLPNQIDKFVSDLSELSLTHNLIGVRINKHGMNLAVIESLDGTSNIDAELIEWIVKEYGRINNA